MFRTTKPLKFAYCLVFVNILLIVGYIQRHSGIKRYIVTKVDEAATTNTTSTMSYPENVTETMTTVEMICPDGKLEGPVKPNPDRAAELYWIYSNMSRPSVDHENVLGDSVSLTNWQLTNRTDVTTSGADSECASNHTVAIIIPFRNREHHLQVLLGHLIPILKRQRMWYTVFVLEQSGTSTFNKGRLMNTGFEFAADLGRTMGKPYDCFIFQDVDLLVEHDTLPYRCSDSEDAVHHLSTAIDKFRYQVLCCGMTVGGVLGFQEHQFRKVNGFPNSLWGWGGEDDDINARIKLQKLKIQRPNSILGRFTMIHHQRDALNPANRNRYAKLRAARSRLHMDGLSSLDTVIKRIERYPLFIKVLVDVGSQSGGVSSIVLRLHKRKITPEITSVP